MAKKRVLNKRPAKIDCGCDVTEAATSGRKAVGVDSDIKAGNLARLKRIEGQVRGLHRMIEQDRYCPDILTQLAAVHEALRGVGRELMRNHLRHCVASAARDGGEGAQVIYDELVELFHRSVK